MPAPRRGDRAPARLRSVGSPTPPRSARRSGRFCRRQARQGRRAASRHQRPPRPQARRLVSPAPGPRRGRRIPRLPRAEPRLAEPRAPAAAHGGGAVRRGRRAPTSSRPISRTASPQRRGRHGGSGLRASRARRQGQGARRSPPRFGARTISAADLERGFLARFGSLLTRSGPQVAPRPAPRRRRALEERPRRTEPRSPSASSRCLSKAEQRRRSARLAVFLRSTAPSRN